VEICTYCETVYRSRPFWRVSLTIGAICALSLSPLLPTRYRSWARRSPLMTPPTPSTLPSSFGSPGHILCSSPVVSWPLYTASAGRFAVLKRCPRSLFRLKTGTTLVEMGSTCQAQTRTTFIPVHQTPEELKSPPCNCVYRLLRYRTRTGRNGCSPCLIDGDRDANTAISVSCKRNSLCSFRWFWLESAPSLGRVVAAL
jgi:hypothetical protein